MTAARRLLLTADAVGGVWTYSIELARALHPLGYEVVLAVLGPAPAEAQHAEAIAIPGLRLVQTGFALEWLAASQTAILNAEAGLAALAAEVGADVVQMHTPALVSLERYPCPVVAVHHSCVATWWSALRGGPPPENFAWRTELVSRGLRNADAVVAPTAAFGRMVQRCYDLPCPPRGVHNGSARSARSGVMRDEVFTAGRLWDEGKNVALLDEAAARLGVPFKAAGPGAGPRGETITLRHIHHVGVLDRAGLMARLVSRPIFASAALYEPFGLAVLEAANAGCALVLSDIPSFREIWGDAAAFVDARDAKGFAAAIETLLGDRALRLEAGRRARERASHYTPAATATKMAAIYASVQRRAAA